MFKTVSFCITPKWYEKLSVYSKRIFLYISIVVSLAQVSYVWLFIILDFWSLYKITHGQYYVKLICSLSGICKSMYNLSDTFMHVYAYCVLPNKTSLTHAHWLARARTTPQECSSRQRFKASPAPFLQPRRITQWNSASRLTEEKPSKRSRSQAIFLNWMGKILKTD